MVETMGSGNGEVAPYFWYLAGWLAMAMADWLSLAMAGWLWLAGYGWLQLAG